MTHHRQAVPAFWGLFCSRFLETTDRLAVELWRALYPSQTVLFYVQRCAESSSMNDLVRFADLVTPRELLRATARLSPEGKGRRRKDVVALERSILDRTGPDGLWL